METPVLSSRPGYIRIATHCFPLTNTSSTLLSMKIRRLTDSSLSKRKGAISGARKLTSGRVDELEDSIIIKLDGVLGIRGLGFAPVTKLTKSSRLIAVLMPQV